MTKPFGRLCSKCYAECRDLTIMASGVGPNVLAPDTFWPNFRFGHAHILRVSLMANDSYFSLQFILATAPNAAKRLGVIDPL